MTDLSVPPTHTRSRSKSAQEMDFDRLQRSQLSLRVRAMEARSWLHQTTGFDPAAAAAAAAATSSASTPAVQTDEEKMEEFFESLRDGVQLCQLINKITKNEEMCAFKIPKNMTSTQLFIARDNISNFITAAKKIGLNEHVVFTTDDLISRKNDSAVVTTLLQLSNFAESKFGIEPPKLVQYDREIDELEKASARRLKRKEAGDSSGAAAALSAVSLSSSSAADSSTSSTEVEEDDEDEEEFEQSISAASSPSVSPALGRRSISIPPASLGAAASSSTDTSSIATSTVPTPISTETLPTPAPTISVSSPNSSAPSRSSVISSSSSSVLAAAPSSSSSSSSSATPSSMPSGHLLAPSSMARRRSSASRMSVSLLSTLPGVAPQISKFTNLEEAIQWKLRQNTLSHIKVNTIIIKNKKQQRSANKKNAGQYRFGAGPKVFVRVIQNELMVRENGVWEDLIAHVRAHNK